jgi:hypothetical protein
LKYISTYLLHAFARKTNPLFEKKFLYLPTATLRLKNETPICKKYEIFGANFVSSGDEVNPYTSNHWERPKGTPVYKNNSDPVGPKFISMIFEFVHSHSLPLFAML